MEIVLVRHGQPEWVRDGLNVVDPPLTELGVRQAAAMADRLADEPFDAVYVSPLQRARQTAAPLYERLGRTEEVAPWLEEIRDPDWHGAPQDMAAQAYRELSERPVVDRWDGLVGGESIRSFTSRIHAGADEFFAEHGVRRVQGEHGLPVWSIDEPGRRIVLVAHVGTNSITMGHLLGLTPTPWEWDRFVMGHASVSRIEAMPVHDGYTFCLTSLSSLEHLAPTDRTR
ncbi:MAG: histidine phosphatase family protein [Ilumatobacteraceae bacterium]